MTGAVKTTRCAVASAAPASLLTMHLYSPASEAWDALITCQGLMIYSLETDSSIYILQTTLISSCASSSPALFLHFLFHAPSVSKLFSQCRITALLLEAETHLYPRLFMMNDEHHKTLLLPVLQLHLLPLYILSSTLSVCQ